MPKVGGKKIYIYTLAMLEFLSFVLGVLCMVESNFV
jgi:hypothetical protein